MTAGRTEHKEARHKAMHTASLACSVSSASPAPPLLCSAALLALLLRAVLSFCVCFFCPFLCSPHPVIAHLPCLCVLPPACLLFCAAWA
jgi:hypothetical protein